MDYTRIVSEAIEMPWAILPGKLSAIRHLLTIRASSATLTAEEIRAAMDAAGPRRTVATSGGVAVIPIVGTIIPRGNMLSESSGAVSAQSISRQLRQALADPEVGSIVLDIDSPGGQVSGVDELATEIYEARGQKPITAVANGLAASAAYWIATAADQVVVTPSGEVGSIGVLAIHEDISEMMKAEGVAVNVISAGKYKTEGNPFGPLDDEARGAMQSRVNEYYEMFVSAVARGRGVKKSDVRNGFGEGRVVGAKQAVSLGMADRVGTLDSVVSRLVGGRSRRRTVAGEIDYRKRRLRLSGQLSDESISQQQQSTIGDRNE